jgi:hypothetical protein
MDGMGSLQRAPKQPLLHSLAALFSGHSTTVHTTAAAYRSTTKTRRDLEEMPSAVDHYVTSMRGPDLPFSNMNQKPQKGHIPTSESLSADVLGSIQKVIG